MVVFPNAKINIGLQVVAKRPDGYHDLASVFYPIPLKDALELTLSTNPGITLITENIPGLGNPEDNLISRAYNLLAKSYSLPNLNCHLIKSIPMGAGLGGGSSDATFALCAINKLANLELSQNTLHSLALELGSDCPFFIENTPSFAEGRGEKLTPLPKFLQGTYLVIVSPKLHISTQQAFAGITPSDDGTDLSKIHEIPRAVWKDVVINDFEKNAFALYPELRKIKTTLFQQGAFYASMTGTGSSMYGLFNDQPYGQMTELGNDQHEVHILEL
jgi:4-diphosphocytidyl-2-C-methyl-D-erythritol kinase